MTSPTIPVTQAAADEVVARVPGHVGIVLDGNRRWARAHGLPTAGHGHRAGFGKIPQVLEWCADLGIRIVTLWMLSDDNITRRSLDELTDLYALNEDVIVKLTVDGRWKLQHLGDPALLPDRLEAALRLTEVETSDNSDLLVNLAIGYGGRRDLLTAIHRLLDDLRTGDVTHITAQHVADRLATAGQPDPDLIIRPSGEVRTSGFLLWQAALSELYFCPRLWPDFTRDDLITAVAAYADRHRRLGA